MPMRPTRAVSQVLQGVELQHHVEAVVVEQGQALFEVQLDHVDAPLGAGQHVGVVYLDAVAGAAVVLREVGQHLAAAAAEVEHARAARHEVGDDVEVASLAHGATSCAMRSKYARITPW